MLQGIEVRVKSCVLFTILIAVLAACGDEGERQETISKLRAIGVEQTPTIPTPGASVQLIFHLLGPQGLALSGTPYVDTANKYGSSAKISLTSPVATEEKLGSISHYTVTAQYTAPTDQSTQAVIAAKGYARVRYGLTVAGSGDDETVIGDTHVYPAGSPQSAWQPPTISIEAPLTSTVSSTTALAGKVVSQHEENNKVRWFVSSGKVKVRSAISTEWQDAGSGEQTVVLTTRGSKTGAFAIKIAKVTVQ